MTERRSLASRAYRATLRPRLVAYIVIIGVVAWSVVLAATPLPGAVETAEEATTFWKIFAAMLGAAVGIVTLFAAGFALGSKYVAEPAAARAVKAHEDKIDAHPTYLSKAVWFEEFAKSHKEILESIERIGKSRGRGGHE